MGFFAAYVLLLWMAKRGLSEMKPSQVADFITYGAILGVMIGGRLGFMLFYNAGEFFANPLIFFKFLDGGMASHGGILGLVIFTWFYAKKTKLSWTGIGDNLCTVAPLGLLFGRLANYVNGELYGRKSDVSWAVKFPDELRHLYGDETREFSPEQLKTVAQKVSEVAPEAGNAAFETLVSNPPNTPGYYYHATQPIIEASWGNEKVQKVLSEFLNPRHPSQLYEAFSEGLLLFAILFIIRVTCKKLYHGVLTGLFFIIYAIARIVCENYREPDADLTLGLTRGQFLSSFMIAIGIAFLVWAFKTKRVNRAVS